MRYSLQQISSKKLSKVSVIKLISIWRVMYPFDSLRKRIILTLTCGFRVGHKLFNI